MPNYCDYRMKVVGKKENLDKFIKKLEDYDEPKHFWRMFQADIYDEGENFVEVGGTCAWSIESCCRASGYSNGIDLFAENTKDLELKLEVWSREEDGMFFEEHYLYDNGKCLTDECENIIPEMPRWDKEDYPTFEEFVEDWGLEDCDISPEDFTDEGEYRFYEKGGFANWGEYEI